MPFFPTGLTLSVKALGFASSPKGGATGVSVRNVLLEQGFSFHKMPGSALIGSSRKSRQQGPPFHEKNKLRRPVRLVRPAKGSPSGRAGERSETERAQIGPTPWRRNRLSWLPLVWQNVMAIARASAVSSGLGIAGRCSRMRVISCTCFFTALP